MNIIVICRILMIGDGEDERDEHASRRVRTSQKDMDQELNETKRQQDLKPITPRIQKPFFSDI
jgi:hypothetical protein